MSRVARFQLFNAFAFSFAWIPVMFPFFTIGKGFDERAFYALVAAYYWTMCVFEVPTGLFADRFGRRPSLVLGSFGFVVSFAWIALAASFAGALGGMVLMGVAHTLLSGADSAWLYDALVAEGREHEYLAIEGRAHWTRMLGVSAFDLAGGAAAQYLGFGAAFVLSILAAAVAGCVALTFDEPAHRIRRETGPGRLRDALARTARSRQVRWIFLYSTLLFVLLRLAFHFYQPHLLELGIENYLFYGAALAVLNLVAAPFARAAPRLEARLGERNLATLLQLAMGASFLLLFAIPGPLGLLVFALQQLPYGVMNPLTRSYTNRHVPSRERATVLSLQSFGGRLVFGIAAALAGVAYARTGTLGPLYLAIGVASLVATATLHITMPRPPPPR